LNILWHVLVILYIKRIITISTLTLILRIDYMSSGVASLTIQSRYANIAMFIKYQQFIPEPAARSAVRGY
jgi:hypothetical protein